MSGRPVEWSGQSNHLLRTRPAVRGAFASSASRPDGWLGVVSGLVMAVENRLTNHRLVDRAELHVGDRALDVGCGPGSAARYGARAAGATVTGVDVSPTVVALARRLHWVATRTTTLHIYEADAAALPYPHGAFTVVWTMNSLHHWRDRTAVLGELRR